MIFFVVESRLDGNALRYAARELFLLARLPHRILTYDAASDAGLEGGVVISYGDRLPPADIAPRIHVFATDGLWPARTVRDTSGAPEPVDYDGLPVVHRGRRPVAGRVDRLGECMVTDLDLFASTFALLSRCEELDASPRDRFGRFPAAQSFAATHGLLARPLVNEYADLLAAWAERFGARAARRPPWSPGFGFCVTHDIDQLTLFSSVRQVASAVRRILRGPRAARRLATVVADGTATLLRRRKDPFDTFATLLAHERSREIRATYYAMAGGRGPHEGRYRLADASPHLAAIAADGHELGIHGSLETWRDRRRLAQEISALERAAEITVRGGRQHYLRLAVPDTWRGAAACGLRYDASLGYPDVPGFRAGTCVPFRPFDVRRGEDIPLWAVPLTVMDATLHTAIGIAPEDGVRCALDLAGAVAKHHGLFVLLWHNGSLYDALHPGWGDAFSRILDGLLALGGESMRMADAVERWERHVHEILDA